MATPYMDKVMQATGFVAELAQGDAPEFHDVSFPTESDTSQKTDLLQTDSVDTGSFGPHAEAERQALAPNAKMLLNAYLNGAGSCLAGGDLRNAVLCLQRAAQVARANYAKHLNGEIDRRVVDAANRLNSTPSAGDAEDHAGPEGEQDSDAQEDLRQGPDTPLTAETALTWSDAARDASAAERAGHAATADPGHVSDAMHGLRQATSGATTGSLAPRSHGLLGGAGRQMYEGHDAIGVVRHHIDAAADAAHSGDSAGAMHHLEQGAGKASGGGMHEVASALHRHAEGLRVAHAHDAIASGHHDEAARHLNVAQRHHDAAIESAGHAGFGSWKHPL